MTTSSLQCSMGEQAEKTTVPIFHLINQLRYHQNSSTTWKVDGAYSRVLVYHDPLLIHLLGVARHLLPLRCFPYILYLLPSKKNIWRLLATFVALFSGCPLFYSETWPSTWGMQRCKSATCGVMKGLSNMAGQ